MQHTFIAVKPAISLLVFTALAFASCKPTYSSYVELNILGNRTISNTHDGVTRKLDTKADIDIQNGHIKKFPKAAFVQIQETGGSEQRQAELRENAGTLELWIKENGSFRKGSPKDYIWLKGFLSEVTSK